MIDSMSRLVCEITQTWHGNTAELHELALT
jgi:hypothetical protein